jgi:hypothetical protein
MTSWTACPKAKAGEISFILCPVCGLLYIFFKKYALLHCKKSVIEV